MGKEDMELKDYFIDRRRYADLWNGGVFGGAQLLREEELSETGTVVSGRGFRNYIESHEECRHMDEETCHILGVMTHFKELERLAVKK